MQWRTPNFNFVKWRRIAMIGSTVANLIAIAAILHGLNYGVDFTGGVVVEATYSEPANLDAIRTGLEGAGFKSVQVQNFGSTSDVMIRLPPAVSIAWTVHVPGELRLALLRTAIMICPLFTAPLAKKMSGIPVFGAFER